MSIARTATDIAGLLYLNYRRDSNFDHLNPYPFHASVSFIRTVIVRRATLLVLAIATVCIVLQAAGLQGVMRFDRDLISSGHWWLLLSGNFVHFGLNHLLLNLAGLALVYALVWANFTTLQWCLITLFSCAGVGMGLYQLDPSIVRYVGFSGALHGLIVAGCLGDLRRYPGQATMLLIAISIKLLVEQTHGALPGSASISGGPVAVNAHLYGALAGAVAGAVVLLFRQPAQTPA